MRSCHFDITKKRVSTSAHPFTLHAVSDFCVKDRISPAGDCYNAYFNGCAEVDTAQAWILWPYILVMHLSIETPAPGYPGMAGTLLPCGRGVDLFFRPGVPGVCRDLLREFTHAKKPGFCGRELGRDLAGFS